MNIPTLEISTNSDTESTFENLSTSSFLKLCSKQSQMKNFILNKNLINDCGNSCFKTNIKIGYDSNTCITSCKAQGYEYEYINICHHNCMIILMQYKIIIIITML